MPQIAIIITGVVLLTLIIGISINGIVAKVLDYKRSNASSSHGHSRNATVDQIADRTDLIEDRLRVLERLATDRGQLLSDEIEALRDSSRDQRRQLDKEAS